VISLPPRMSASAGGPPPAPPGGNVRMRFAPPSSFRGPARPPARREVERAAPPPPADPSAYLTKLAVLARELDAAATSGAPLPRLRMLWQRIVEWLEDLRSVGGFDSLGHAVDAQVKRLAVALDDGNAAELRAIASELLAVATGAPVPPKRGGREAFWK
ncbi:MAG: hypothetical protein HOV81_35935, partial [Kofleriaceae bacterium]|nr:hypothetical protein [Kofleriaceae bacterium]